MANPRRNILGIEIGPREIRMVEMRGGSPQPQLVRAGSVPLPVGAFHGDRIVQVDVVAELIRGLHGRLGCQTRTAVVGMPVQSVVTRILAIPRVPEQELRTVIEGELAHYQILRAGAGAFDFFRMETPAGSVESQPSVLLMAVEDRIAQGYRLAVERSGLQMLALEPITLSLFRAAYPQLGAEPAALCLAISPERSELSILDHRQLRLYRRLDTGSNDLIAGRVPTQGTGRLGDTGDLTSVGRSLLNPDSEEAAQELVGAEAPRMPRTGGSDTMPLGSAGPGGIVMQAAAALAGDVQRSLDYYRREFPNATAVGKLILATNDPEVEAVAEWLGQALRMDVRVAEPPTNPNLATQAGAQMQSYQELKYLGAAGLALHALMPDWPEVPRFNLSSTALTERRVPAEREWLTVSMILSLSLLAGGMLFSFLWNRQADTEAQTVGQIQRNIFTTQEKLVDRMKQLEDEKALRTIIRMDNLPVPRLMDVIGATVPGDVGLTNTDIQRTGRISIDGKALTLSNFNLFYSRLMGCTEQLTPPRLLQLSTDPMTGVVTFRIETNLIGTHDAVASKRTNP